MLLDHILVHSDPLSTEAKLFISLKESPPPRIELGTAVIQSQKKSTVQRRKIEALDSFLLLPESADYGRDYPAAFEFIVYLIIKNIIKTTPTMTHLTVLPAPTTLSKKINQKPDLMIGYQTPDSFIPVLFVKTDLTQSTPPPKPVVEEPYNIPVILITAQQVFFPNNDRAKSILNFIHNYKSGIALQGQEYVQRSLDEGFGSIPTS